MAEKRNPKRSNLPGILTPKADIAIRSSAAEYLTFVAATGDNPTSIEMRYEDENIWLTQKMLAELYDVEIPTIYEHLKKIYDDHELSEGATIRNFLIVQIEGNREVERDVKHYALQAIIAVGFKVNSARAVQFRKWVNKIAKDYTIQGWAMDKERLMNGGSVLTETYFEYLLQEIREIRLSERKFYQKVTDIYSTSLDYDPSSKTTLDFFAKVQNKLHYSIQQDVGIAKNYMTKDELEALGRIVNAYLDIAELRARRKMPMTMQDWSAQLDLVLQADGSEILKDAGRITAEIAKQHAETEFEKYRIIQDKLFESDFDKYMARLTRQLEITDGEESES